MTTLTPRSNEHFDPGAGAAGYAKGSLSTGVHGESAFAAGAIAANTPIALNNAAYSNFLIRYLLSSVNNDPGLGPPSFVLRLRHVRRDTLGVRTAARKGEAWVTAAMRTSPRAATETPH